MRMAKDLVAFWMAALPVIPEAGKWTLLGPCVDWHLLGFAANRCIQHLTTVAFAALDLQLHAGKGVDGQLTWQELRGVRVTKSFKLVAEVDVEVRLCIYALVLEPVHYLTAWSLRKSKDFIDPCTDPPLLDVTFAEASPATVALQYLASLVDGSPSRLVLLWRMAGCTSSTDFFDNRPAWSSLLRASSFNTIAWVRRRWSLKFESYLYC